MEKNLPKHAGLLFRLGMIPGSIRLFVFMFMIMGVTAAANAQEQRVELKLENSTLIDAIKDLSAASGLEFFYNSGELGADSKRITSHFKDVPVGSILDNILSGTPFTYNVEDGTIVIMQRTRQAANRDANNITLTGRIIDGSTGEALPGVTVMVQDTKQGVSTDSEGRFSIAVNKEGATLVFSFIGYETKSIKFTGSNQNVFANISLKLAEVEIGEVVITGMFERKSESFTGSTSVVKKDELLRSGNQNLLHSLKNIDPSFRVIESMEFGSDPNHMPEIQLRGQQGIPDIKSSYTGNPNQPLFILDGFEASATTIFDLDMNRIETVVLLKDAAAKAIYGARAANGVVVIETRSPQAGILNISYKGDLNITVPDLTGYNLCNAWEKYVVERDNPYGQEELFYEQHLNDILSEIARGVDTYWLAKPLHVGVGHRHSLLFEGGDEYVRYSADVLYNDVTGAMKGSNRRTFTGGLTLSYKYRTLLFKNQFNVTLNKANDSPYGSFSEYTSLNPYWTPYDEDGNLKKVVGITGGSYFVENSIGNPLWNVDIGTKNFSKYTELTNNFYIEWNVIESLKLVGRLGLSRNQSTREDFYPASHTKFASYSEENFLKRGSYGQTHGETSMVRGDLNANYSLLSGKNQLFINGGFNIQQDKGESVYHYVEGFPNDFMDFIAFGKEYPANSKPSGNESVSREIGFMAATNYSYDNRYLADLSYRASASSMFGKDKRWGQFWSAGIGWNLHKESFFKSVDWLKQLKVRASTGYTGSQNFNPYQALATFGYYQTQVYDSWVGSYLLGLPNNDLKWQKTQDINIGFDLNLFSRIIVRYDYYIQNTKDQLLDLTIPPSMGFTSYKENLGSTQNKGMEFKLNSHVLFNTEKDQYLSLFFTIAGNRNKIKKISNALRSYNDSNDNQLQNGSSSEVRKPLVRYEEGQSMNAIWAVRSLGIDPSSGNELFLTKNNQITSQWDAADQVVCGDAMPKCSGNFGVNMDFNGITLNLSFAYQYGGQIYNQTLVDRVENANIYYNVDKRIYDAVWKQPGDKVAFSYNRNKATKPSSRFVEDLNELRLATLNVGYDFKNSIFLKKIGFDRLKANFYMDDVFRISSVKTERGLSYPFARTFSISLQATF